MYMYRIICVYSIQNTCTCIQIHIDMHTHTLSLYAYTRVFMPQLVSFRLYEMCGMPYGASGTWNVDGP